MKRDLRGKRVIVTGATSGIGRATAIAFSRAGSKVALAARDSGKLEELAAELVVGVVMGVRTDITRPDDRDRLIATVAERWGGLDLLVNIAGIASWGHFATGTEAINRQVLETNFFAPVELSRLAVPLLTSGNQPAIVNLTSMTGRRGMPAWPEYSASKAALVGFSEAMRGEMTRFGIDVITIVPGLTNTLLSQHLLRSEGRVRIPYETGMPPEYVAVKLLDAVRQNKTEVVLGTEAKQILAMNRWLPRRLNRIIASYVTTEYS